QRPGPRTVILRVARDLAIETIGERDGHAVLPGVQPDRYEHRLAGGANAVEAAGLGPVAGPGVKGAGVEMAVGRAEPAPKAAVRHGWARQGTHPALHPPADDLVRHHEDLAVAVREIQQRPPQWLPGRMVALHPHEFGRGAVEGIRDPADRWLHR